MFKNELQEFVKAFTEGNGRPVGSPGHEAARKMLVDRLNDLRLRYNNALQPYAGDDFEMPYSFNGQSYTNIIARIKSSSNKKPILIAAHYDTCGHQPGADDNAAAIAITFHIAERLLSEGTLKNLGCDLILAFFDAEEAPNMVNRSMGSIRFYEDQRKEEIGLAIVMDLVGHDVPVPGLEKLIAVTGMETDSSLEKLLNSVETGNEIGLVAIQNRYIGDLSDHHIFRLNNVPFLFFSCGHWQHYHQATDTWEKLNYNKMEAIANYLHDLILTYSTFDPTKSPADYDPTQTELKLMNRSLKPLLQAKGIVELKSRAEMEQVIQMLLSFGL